MKKNRNVFNGEGGITVLALLDGTNTDGPVAEQAARLAARSRGRLVLLRPLPLVARSEQRPGGGAPAIQPWELMRSQKATAQRELSELSQDLGVSVEVRVGFGDKADVVAEVAAGREVDLVVAAVPTRRRLPWLKRDFSLLAEVPIPVTWVSPQVGEGASLGLRAVLRPKASAN